MLRFTRTILWLPCLVLTVSWLSVDVSSAQDEPQVGKAEIVNLKVGRYHRLAKDVSETVQRGLIQYVAAPKGYSFVVVWLDLKLTPGKDEDGDAKTYIPERIISFNLEGGKKLVTVGQCTVDGRMSFSTYRSSYSMYGVPEKETVSYSQVVAVPDDVTKFKFTFGTETKDVEAPSQVEPTIDRVVNATFKVAKIEVVDKLEDKIRVGDYNDPIGDAIITNEGPNSKFVILQLYVKGKASNNDEGGFNFLTSDLGALYGASVYAQPMGTMSDDRFSPGYEFIRSEQDVVGDFSTSAIRLVFPLPGKITKFKLLYLMQPVAEIEVPK